MCLESPSPRTYVKIHFTEIAIAVLRAKWSQPIQGKSGFFAEERAAAARRMKPIRRKFAVCRVWFGRDDEGFSAMSRSRTAVSNV
jgi:hypothetical protein